MTSNGEVYSHDTKVTKIMLNDEEIFNGNVVLLTRNIPVDLLKTAEIINDYGNESIITGIKGEPSKTLNIHTKRPNTKGLFGN